MTYENTFHYYSRGLDYPQINYYIFYGNLKQLDECNTRNQSIAATNFGDHYTELNTAVVLGVARDSLFQSRKVQSFEFITVEDIFTKIQMASDILFHSLYVEDDYVYVHELLLLELHRLNDLAKLEEDDATIKMSLGRLIK